MAKIKNIKIKESFGDRVLNLFIGIICMILAIFSFLMALSETGVITWMPAVNGDSHVQSMWRGFVMGAACGIMGLMIFGLIRNIRALRSEKELKKLYVKEHDERQIQIWTAARAAATQTFLLVGLAAGTVAGYFSMTVSITILACVTAHSLIAMGFKIYYSTKF